MALTSKTALAQQSDNTKIPNAYWASFGAGASSLGALSGMYSVNVQIPHNWLVTVDLDGGANRSGKTYDTNYSQSVISFNILAGKMARQKFSLFTLSAGLGLVDVHTGLGSYGLQDAPYINKDQYTLGIPIVIQGYLVGLQAFGIGFSGNINLNTIKPTAGINLSFALGRMQTHTPRF